MRNPLLTLIACSGCRLRLRRHICGRRLHRTAQPALPRTRQAKKNEQGIVKLRVQVAPDGSVRYVKLVESSGSLALDRAARRAVREAKFQAAQRRGKPMPTEFDTSFTFLLD